MKMAIEMQPLYAQGFAPLEQEFTLDELPVAGRIPGWLSGMLVRNGPARFDLPQQSLRHWFDGQAMLHKFAFSGGKVSYANKFVVSPAYEYAEREGKLGYLEFASDPCRSIFKRFTTMFDQEGGYNTNVSIGKVADKFVAWTELPLPIEFDPQTLATVGLVRFDDKLVGVVSTPHPHADRNGDGINNMVKFGAPSAYNLFRTAAHEAKRTLIASLPTMRPAYMHSFSITEHYAILAEYPLYFNSLGLLLSGKAVAENMDWQPERGMNFLVVELASGKLVGKYRSNPFFCFHHVNAYEEGDEIVVDLLAFPDPSIIQALYLEPLRHPQAEVTPVPLPTLRRYRVPLAGTTVQAETLTEVSMELPRINYAYNGRPYRYAYAQGLSDQRPHDFLNQLVKADVQQRSTQTWFVPGCYPGEPVFVAAPNAQAEDDGVILSVVLDSEQANSFLLVLDASSFTELGRATVPHHIPFGFHGMYFG